MKWTREANVFTDLFIHVKAWRFELPLQDRTELSLSFPSSYFSPFVYSLLSRCCLVFLSLWNDWNLLRFLWANQFTGGEEQKRENFRCVRPPRKNELRFCRTCPWPLISLRLRSGPGRKIILLRLRNFDWESQDTWSDSKGSWQAGRWGRLSGAKLRRNCKRCARSPFLAVERDVLFHQSCEAFRPCGYLITLISARLSLFRWTSGILMKAEENRTAHGEKKLSWLHQGKEHSKEIENKSKYFQLG